jgi:hypothetical protein
VRELKLQGFADAGFGNKSHSVRVRELKHCGVTSVALRIAASHPVRVRESKPGYTALVRRPLRRTPYGCVN